MKHPPLTHAMSDHAHAPKTLLPAFVFPTASWTFSLAVFFLTFLVILSAKVSWSAILVTSATFVAAKCLPVGVPFEVGLPETALSGF